MFLPCALDICAIMKYNNNVDYLSHYFPFGVCLVSSKMRVTEPPLQKANRNNSFGGRVRSSQMMLREHKAVHGITMPCGRYKYIN